MCDTKMKCNLLGLKSDFVADSYLLVCCDSFEQQTQLSAVFDRQNSRSNVEFQIIIMFYLPTQFPPTFVLSTFYHLLVGLTIEE